MPLRHWFFIVLGSCIINEFDNEIYRLSRHISQNKFESTQIHIEKLLPVPIVIFDKHFCITYQDEQSLGTSDGNIEPLQLDFEIKMNKWNNASSDFKWWIA